MLHLLFDQGTDAVLVLCFVYIGFVAAFFSVLFSSFIFLRLYIFLVKLVAFRGYIGRFYIYIFFLRKFNLGTMVS